MRRKRGVQRDVRLEDTGVADLSRLAVMRGPATNRLLCLVKVVDPVPCSPNLRVTASLVHVQESCRPSTKHI